nr:T9SS type A sorting domain-containing protein [Bacteroidota bacterium]
MNTFYTFLKKAFASTIVVCSLLLNVNAQLWTTDNVTVTVQATATITVQGDIQNQNGGQFFNSGTIDLSGNWIHNSANNCFSTSAGTVIFNGASQTIGGTNPTTFNNLTLIGTGIKTLNVNTTVGGAYVGPAGILSLGTRNLDLNSKTLTISNSSLSAITRTTGFIISETPAVPGYGNILWNIGANTGAYVYPFGNAVTNNYLPFTLNITTAGVGANGSAMVATYPTNTAATPNNRPLPPPVPSTAAYWGGAENSMNVLDRWWPVTVANYTTNPVSSLTFSYRESEWDATGGSTNIITEANLGAQRHNGVSGWIMPPAGIDNPAANTCTITGVNGYNIAWVLVEKDAPLPVSLLSFNAALNANKQTDLKWEVANEDNVLHYEIEKSSDAKKFTFLQNVTAIGLVNGKTNAYKGLDISPYFGNTYYRLKIVKTWGEISYSPVRVVSLNNSSNISVSIYPNPANSNTTVVLSLLNTSLTLTDFRIEFIDMYGQMVDMAFIKKENLKLNNSVELNLQNIAPGNYVVRITDGVSTLESVKLMVQK